MPRCQIFIALYRLIRGVKSFLQQKRDAVDDLKYIVDFD
jgi:hypothetical protein